MKNLIWVFLILFPQTAGAVTATYSVDMIGAYKNTETKAQKIDPNNRVLETPKHDLIFDLRPNLNLKEDTLDVYLRPRFKYDTQWVYYGDGGSRTKDDRKLEVSEAYSNWMVNDTLLFSFGLQNYQWGPAELLSPSNPIFHFSSSQKSVLYRERGKWLVRSNVSVGSNWNIVAFGEVIDNKEDQWIAEETYTNKFLAKVEYKDNDGVHYAGLTGGLGEQRRPFVGEYANYGIDDELSVYGDAAHMQGSPAYYPMKDNNGFIEMSQRYKSSTDVFSLFVLGARYESTVDVRLEYIENQFGYDKIAHEEAVRSNTQLSPYLVNNLKRSPKPGLELVGLRYGYFSLRWPDVGKNKKYTLAARHLHSFTDQSGVVATSVERTLGDSATGVLEYNYNFGEEGTDLAFFEQSSLVAAVKYYW